jgi:hypothetical protein
LTISHAIKDVKHGKNRGVLYSFLEKLEEISAEVSKAATIEAGRF